VLFVDILNYFFSTDVAETKVHWANDIASDNLPPLKRELEWYEDTEKRDYVNSIFLGLGTLSAGIAIFSAVCLTVTLTTILVTASFTLAATALLVAAVYFATMEPCELDPIYRLEKRQELLSSSDAPHFSELTSALRGEILTENEIQSILKQEINRMDFHSFLRKHDIHGLRFLDSSNLSLLRPSYLAYLSSLMEDLGVKTENDFDIILNSEEARIFDLTVSELLVFFQTKETEPDEQNKTSIFETMGSYASSAFGVAKSSSGNVIGSAARMALKVAKTVTPKPLVNVAQCSAASFTFATQGKFKESANAALGAVTCAALFVAEQDLKAENPEEYQIVKDLIKFENLDNQIR
jgi:hypothetical protein